MSVTINISGSVASLVVNTNRQGASITANGDEVWSAGPKPSKFKFSMPSDSLQLQLSYIQSADNAVTIDWGDGSTPETSTGTTVNIKSHTYAAEGEYTVTFTCVVGESWEPGTDSYAFTGSSSLNRSKLTEITFGDGVTKIHKSAFAREISLTKIVIPDFITQIGEQAFTNCTNVTEMHIGTGILSFENRWCATLTSLETIYLGNIATFANISPSASTPANAEPFYQGAASKAKAIYLNGTYQTFLTIPASVPTVHQARFSKLGSILNIEVASATIDTRAFMNSSALKKVWIRDTVTTINGSSASNAPFSGCPDDMQIYCEADEAPAGWESYWNYIASGTAITPVWGQKTSPF